jgi:hypothetical protein
MNPKYFQLDWTVDGLIPNTDFSMNNGFLIVKAYALAKMRNSPAGRIVNITNLSTRLNSRLLQEDAEVTPVD